MGFAVCRIYTRHRQEGTPLSAFLPIAVPPVRLTEHPFQPGLSLERRVLTVTGTNIDVSQSTRGVVCVKN